jgi:non-heme chloroperoxidase
VLAPMSSVPAPRTFQSMATQELSQAKDGGPARTTQVRGGGGVGLHVQESGKKTGPPILVIHGWSQSQLCWVRQMAGRLADEFRLVTFDNRGHGMSEKPTEADSYNDGQLWADDLAAVIDELALDRPVLVGWSYGGFIVTDYVRAYGEERIAGINLVGGAVILKPPTFDHLGPGLLDNAQDACAADLSTSIAAVQRFLRACTAQALSDDDWSTALCWNMAVPAEVRAALIAREINGDDVLSSLSVPVLVTHGRADLIVLPSMAEHVLEVCETAEPSWYEGVGHAPFLEDPLRFNRELAEFAGRVASGHPA